MPSARRGAAARGAREKGPDVSNDPPLFNTSIRKLDEPIASRRAATIIGRMQRHAQQERAWREDRIVENLQAAWRRAIREFREARP